MATRLLGAHVNATVSGVAETIMEWKPPLVVLLDHSDVWRTVKAESPNTLFVGRIYKKQEPDFNDPDLDPVEVARDHCDMILPWAERMGETVSYWQGVNEPIIASPESMMRYAAFDAERARIMDEHGFRVVVGTFSVGNPEMALWSDFMPALEAAKQYDGALALHEYAWPTLDYNWPWLLLRHRKVYAGEPERDWEGLPRHLTGLPLLITECGLDGLIEDGRTPRGWRALYDQKPREYLDQLTWYDAELRKDRYVVGAAIYCCGVPDSQWHSYDIWQGIARALARRAKPIYRLADTQPAQPSAPVTPVVPPVSGWKMETVHRVGPRIIAGSLPRAGIEVTITDPWGNASRVVSGSKREHGEGGFEVLAPHVATYTVSFLGRSFEVQTEGRAAILTFTEEAPVEEPMPEEETPVVPPTPSSPVDEGVMGPETPAELASGPETLPGEDEMMVLVVERLDRVAKLLQERL